MNKSKRLFIDPFCLSIINSFLTKEDFQKMNIQLKNVHLIDTKEKSYNNLVEIKEQVNLYITQSRKDIFLLLIEAYSSIYSKFPEIETFIIFIPGITYEIRDYIISNELSFRFKTFNFRMDLIPIDNDLLSLEKEKYFREIYIDKNLSPISELANAFVKLESFFGKVKHKYIKGDNSKFFLNLVSQKEKENDLKETDEIFGMIVLDRSVDFLTTITSNYTYEGLIDDFFQINLGNIKIKESLIKDINYNIKNNNNQEKYLTYALTSFNNNFYSQIGCMHYLVANKFLNKITEHYQSITNNNKKKDLSLEELQKMSYDLKVFMTEIKSPLTSNKNILYHIINNIDNEQYIQYIKNEQILLTGVLPPKLHLFYEDYISDKRDLYKLLKLMSIESLTQGGIKDFNSIKKDILNVYGYQNIFLFRDLENLGWLRDRSNSKNSIGMNYAQIYEKLELVKMDFDMEKIEDCSYVMGGYCPIGLKLIEKGLEGKWNKIQDIIRKIPGEVSFPNDESEIYKPNEEVNTIFLVFIGGVTYTEIEAVRFLNRKFKENYDKSINQNPKRIQLIIVTTCILNTNKIFSNLGKTFEVSYSMKEFYQQTLNSKKKKK